MIMGDKSISVVLHTDKAFDARVLEVWLKVVNSCRDGAELVLLSFNEDDPVPNEFQDKHENDGIRIVSILSPLEYNWTPVMHESQHYIDGRYVWCSPGNIYQNGDITKVLYRKLDDFTCHVLGKVSIKEPFDYSTMWPVPTERHAFYEQPALLQESFTVQSRAFKDTATLLKSPSDGASVAATWRNLAGITCLFSEKPAVFVIQN